MAGSEISQAGLRMEGILRRLGFERMNPTYVDAGALAVKPNQDPEKSNYKVALTPEGFRLRIRKLEETIRSYQSRQADCKRQVTKLQ